MKFAIILMISLSGCMHLTNNYVTHKKADQLEQQIARNYYLLRCDLCDAYSNPGTEANQKCIIFETKRWLEIKRRRNWK